MDIINIDTNKIKECGKDMMNLSNELKEQIDGLFDSILNIKKTCWTGKSADEFINLTKQEKLQYVQEQLSATLIRIQELDDNITEAQSQIDDLGKQLDELQVKIQENEADLTKKQEQYDKNKAMYEKRLAVMYETKTITYLDIFLSSSSIIELVANYYYLEEIIESDKNLLNIINEEKEKLELAKISLDEQKANLKLLKAKQEQTYIAMQNNRTIQQSYINQLSDNEKQLQDQIAKYKSEEQRIQNLIDFASGMGYDGEYIGGLMAWPVAKSGTYITSDYGEREHPVQGIVKKHTGIDIGNAGYGAPIIAAADGVVSYADTLGGYGNCVIINHGNGISTLYGHGQAIHTTVGTKVKKGDLIMEVGSTGVSTGPHLHFEVRINGTNVDPKPYLQ